LELLPDLARGSMQLECGRPMRNELIQSSIE